MQDERYCECGCGAVLQNPQRRWAKGHHFRRALAERFWAKVDKHGPGGCWLWTAARTSHGYGVVRIDRRNVGAHRIAYELTVGPIPDGYDIDHLCRTPACVNPEHLEAVTHAENCRRGIAGAAHRAWTHCVHGHPFDQDNTIVTKKGTRRCRACKRIDAQRYRRQAQEDQ